MKAKTKFAYLLSAGGSLLSKENLGRRFQLPHKKPALSGKTISTRNSIPDGETELRTVKASISLRNGLSGLHRIIERIGREARAHRKPKHV